MKILISGVLGGVVVFVWGAISHTLLPIGHMGIKALPNEDAVVSAMKTSIHEPGFYFFPGLDESREMSEAQQTAWEAKLIAGPTGVLVYHPGGGQPLSARQLLTELASNVLAALLAALLLVQTIASFGVRVFLAALLGLFA